MNNEAKKAMQNAIQSGDEVIEVNYSLLNKQGEVWIDPSIFNHQGLSNEDLVERAENGKYWKIASGGAHERSKILYNEA